MRDQDDGRLDTIVIPAKAGIQRNRMAHALESLGDATIPCMVL